MAGTTRHHRNPALTGQTRSRQRSMQSGYTGLQSGQTWVKAGSGMQVRTAGLKANDDTEGRQMQDANRRRFWQSCLLGLMLLTLAGNSHSDDSIINRVEALQAGEPWWFLALTCTPGTRSCSSMKPETTNRHGALSRHGRNCCKPSAKSPMKA